jgi:hypothetical protein
MATTDGFSLLDRVVSNYFYYLKAVTWNASLIKGDVAAEIAKNQERIRQKIITPPADAPVIRTVRPVK